MTKNHKKLQLKKSSLMHSMMFIGLILIISLDNSGLTTIERQSKQSSDYPLERTIPDGSSTIIWSIEQSPITIDSIFLIDESQILEIQPGVVVQFTQTGGMDIRGKIIADGDVDSPITFTRVSGIEIWEGLINIYTKNDPSQFTWCIFEYGGSLNYEGMINLFGMGRFSNCTFRMNQPDCGVITYRDGSYGLIENCIFNNNTCLKYTQQGTDIGVIDLGYSWGNDEFDTIIKQNVIINNEAWGIGVYTAMLESHIYIYNNIIVNNSGDIKGNFYYSPLQHAGYNDIWNNEMEYYLAYLQPTSLSQDPMFSDPGGGNFFLSLTSPCRFAGLNSEHMGIEGRVNFSPEYYIEEFDPYYFIGVPFVLNATGSWDAEMDQITISLDWVPTITYDLVEMEYLLYKLTLFNLGDLSLNVTLHEFGNSNTSNYLIEVRDFTANMPPVLTSPDVFQGVPTSKHLIELNWEPLPYVNDYTVYHSRDPIEEGNGNVQVLADVIGLRYQPFLEEEGTHYFVVQGNNDTYSSPFSNNIEVVIQFTEISDLFSPLDPYNGKLYHSPKGNIYWKFEERSDIDDWKMNIYLAEVGNNLDKVGESQYYANYEPNIGYSRFYFEFLPHTQYLWQLEMEHLINHTVLRGSSWTFNTGGIPDLTEIPLEPINALNSVQVSGITSNNTGLWISYESKKELEYYDLSMITSGFLSPTTTLDLNEYTYSDSYLESYPVSDLSFDSSSLLCLFEFQSMTVTQLNQTLQEINSIYFNYYGEALGYYNYNNSMVISASSTSGRVGFNGNFETEELYDFGWQTDLQGMGVDPFYNIWISSYDTLFRCRLSYNITQDRYTMVILDQFIVKTPAYTPQVFSIEDICYFEKNYYLVYRDLSENSYIAKLSGNIASNLQLYSPNSSYLSNAINHTFSWTEVGFASNYQIEISQYPDFSDPIYTIITNTTVIENLTFGIDGIYYWHVRSCDKAGIWEAWTESQYFIIDTTPPDIISLVSPSSMTNITQLESVLTWNPILDATEYQIQISHFSDFGNLDIDETSDLASFDIWEKLINGTYFWRVRASDDALNWGEWSDIWQFHYSIFIEKVNLTAPLNDSEWNLREVSFFWSEISYADHYQFQIGTTFDFSEILLDNISTDPYILLGHLPNNLTYYWRVRAGDVLGNWGEWSEIRRFNLFVLIEITHLSYPFDYMDINSTEIILQWDQVTEAAIYRIQVSLTENFSEIILDVNSSATFVNLKDLTNNTVYYWRVQACDSFGNWGDWSEIGTFQILVEIPPDYIDDPFNFSSINGYGGFWLISCFFVSAVIITKHRKH
ncbi:MAG: hypothetical protein ACTSYI_09990 [Promethearchaeota archaeon]